MRVTQISVLWSIIRFSIELLSSSLPLPPKWRSKSHHSKYTHSNRYIIIQNINFNKTKRITHIQRFWVMRVIFVWPTHLIFCMWLFLSVVETERWFGYVFFVSIYNVYFLLVFFHFEYELHVAIFTHFCKNSAWHWMYLFVYACARLFRPIGWLFAIASNR